MITALALFEGVVIFAALGATIFLWHPPDSWLTAWLPLAHAGGLALGVVTALYYADCYELRSVPTVSRFIARLPRCVALAALSLAISYLLYPDTRIAILLTAVFMVGLLPVVRAVFYGIVGLSPFARRVLIIGSGPLAHAVVEAIEEAGGRYLIVGVTDDGGRPVEPFARYPYLGPLQDLQRIIDATRPHRIVVALEDRRRRLPVRTLLDARFRGVMVEEGADLYERLTGKIAIEALTPSSLIFSPDFRPAPLALLVGRLASVTAALVGLIALFPVLALIAVAIHLDSAGPILFIQERVGLNGRRFKLMKFRTMHVTEACPSEWALDNRDRITRVGRWLRTFRLDELPQFVNILRGDMDLVGPRPHPVTNFSLFVMVLRNSPECGEQIPYYSVRSMVRPGITGWAQVRYRYANNLEEEIEKMRYDLYYVKHRSLWLDLRILVDTVKTVLAGHGAVPAEAPAGAIAANHTDTWTLAARPR